MLNIRHRRTAPAIALGFSLIELMVSIAIGMIVVAGAVSLIVAIDQSNSETIQATRLTQELRTLAGVIADDIKRTRRLDDPIAMVGQGSSNTCPDAPKTPDQPCYTISTAGTSGCLFYGYTGTIGNSSIYNYRYVWLNGSNIELDQYSLDPIGVGAGVDLPTLPPTAGADFTACPISSAPGAPDNTTLTTATLNSSQISITSFCVSSSADGGTCYFDSDPTARTCKLNTLATPATNEIDVCVAGQLTAGDRYMKTITNGFVQPIFVRSNAAGS